MADTTATIKHWDGPGLDAWRAWTPQEAAERLSGVTVPWCVVGGWAIELAVGRPLRSHDDLEIAIPRPYFPSIADHLSEYRFHAVGDGEVRALPAGEPPPGDKHQSWVLEPGAGHWRIDVMLEPGDAETWVFRRDARVCAPRARMVAVRGGVPYLRPEGALLFKAKARRPKDEADFEACLPVLDPEARNWLRDALCLVHPDHDWIARLQMR